MTTDQPTTEEVMLLISFSVYESLPEDEEPGKACRGKYINAFARRFTGTNRFGIMVAAERYAKRYSEANNVVCSVLQIPSS